MSDITGRKTLRKFNINNLIKVRLTDEGKAIYRQNTQAPLLEDRNGFVVFQAWPFMYMFGEHMLHKSIIKDNDIYIFEADLKEVKEKKDGEPCD